MNLIERATVIHYHRHRIASFGIAAPEALGWKCASSQHQRFETLCEGIDFTDSSVLDLGCGTGDLKAALDARYRGVSYLGVEQVPEFVTEARRRFAHDRHAHFEQGDFQAMQFPRVDHVVACGALCYRSASPQFVYQAIARMYAVAARTVAINLLDAAHFPAHPLLVGQDIDAITAFCGQLSPRVDVLRGQSPEDVTLFMRLA